MAALAGVLGWPVAHSRSPKLHNYWLAQHGIDGAYVPLAVAPQDLAVAVAGLRAAGFRGANVTIPHKEAVVGLCTVLEESARRAGGAVNTLVFTDSGIEGRNTDGAGFLANVRACLAGDGGGLPGEPSPFPSLRDGPLPSPASGRGRFECVLLLGAGGAARAIAAALLAEGAAVTVANRGAERAAALAAALPGVQLLAWEDRGAALADFGMLVNTTSLGMAGQPALAMDLARARADLVVADIVYVPLETPLLAAARARGLAVVPGLGMLLHQAVPGFAAWFGVTPVVDAALEAMMAEGIAPR